MTSPSQHASGEAKGLTTTSEMKLQAFVGILCCLSLFFVLGSEAAGTEGNLFVVYTLHTPPNPNVTMRIPLISSCGHSIILPLIFD